jgi:hypothetical protein
MGDDLEFASISTVGPPCRHALLALTGRAASCSVVRGSHERMGAHARDQKYSKAASPNLHTTRNELSTVARLLRRRTILWKLVWHRVSSVITNSFTAMERRSSTRAGRGSALTTRVAPFRPRCTSS